MRGAPGLGSSHTQGNFSNQSNIYLRKYKDMQLSKCCDAEIKIVMVDDHVGHGIHEEAECSNCGELFPEIYDDEETDNLVNTQRMTSIEWLAQAVYDKMKMKGDGRVFQGILDHAKEMHKQEIIDAHLDGQSLVSCKDEYAEQYYNETFKKD